MSSPYPREVKTPTDREVYAMQQVCTWLNRLQNENTSINIYEVHDKIWNDKEEIVEEYKEEHFHTALNDYIFNHEEEIQKLINTESIDDRVTILNNCLDTIMDRFGYIKIDRPSYDELESLILEEVKNMNNSQHQPNFENI